MTNDTRNSFTKALNITLQHEGGFVYDPIDRSNGETNWGITEGVALAHGYTGEMIDMPLSFAESIYRKSYWDKLKLDYIAAHYEPLALVLFDLGVNMGVMTAAKFLQEAINVVKDGANIKVDGIIGNSTLLELKDITRIDERVGLLKMIEIQRGARYLAICKNDPSQEKFIFGWLKRVNLGGDYGTEK